MMYKFREWYIPERMMVGLTRYVVEGRQPGHFLTAIICNDFAEACHRADDENLHNLPAYAAYLYNEMPAPAHGSKERMVAWIRAHEQKETT